jgi:hypothetical protein
MTMNRWHLLMATEILVAAGVVSEASAQPNLPVRPRELPAAK